MAEYRSRHARKKRPVLGVILILLMVVACPAAVLAGAFVAFEIGTRP
jgi:hypothetical protein